jgi:hypothetical protein
VAHWSQDALCALTPSVDFTDARCRAEALRLCAECPVRVPCRAEAIALAPSGVVQGGLAWPGGRNYSRARRVAEALAGETGSPA